jgi:peptidoglycan/xylan/chitin deacetylase (PgdA/CDA1 family)
MPNPSPWTHAFGAAAVCAATLHAAAVEPVPDKTVVLTFDDGVRSHLAFVAPLLKEHGFHATFFVPRCWRDDEENFLSWEDVGQLHAMGFEIGNHTWTHSGFGSPKMAGRLAGELALVERELEAVGVPKPVSFAWPGNGFGTEALEVLRGCGYQFARRGMQPEVPYGAVKPGPMYDVAGHHPLLIPSAGDAYPEWDLDAFKGVVDRAKDGRIAVVQFHGVPDKAHPWVHTDPGRFAEFVAYLKEGGFNVIALRDLARYVDLEAKFPDPMVSVRYQAGQAIELPQEVLATRADFPYWLDNMIAGHGFTPEEAAVVCGYPVALLERKLKALNLHYEPGVPRSAGGGPAILPYPGGRHPRRGFLDGAVSPMRGTKVSIFPPWDEGGYVVVDLPEAIWSNLGLTFLAHTHIPTIWDEEGVALDNIDWLRGASGELTHERRLPNGIRFGARVIPQTDSVEMELWLENGTEQALTDMRAQICVMLAAAAGFEYSIKERGRFEDGVARVSSEDGRRWILTAFERCVHGWSNPPVPCMHSDPGLRDAAPGERVKVAGKLWFYEGDDPDAEIARVLAK